MKQKYWVGILILLLFVSSALPARNSGESKRYNKIYDEFMNLQGDPARTAQVSNFTLVRDAGTFCFQEGQIFLCTPIDGKDRVCVFIGKGTFTCVPPNEVERGQIQRAYGTDTLKMIFHRLFLVVGDTTLEELKTAVPFLPGEIPKTVSLFIKSSLKYQGERDGKNADVYIMKTFLEGLNTGLFYAQLDVEDQDPLMFLIDPLDDEEVCLLRRAETNHFYNERDIISQFQIRKRTAEMVQQRNWYKTEKYSVTCNFADNFDLTASAEVVFYRQKKGHTWFSFVLHDELIVDSVFSALNVPLPFFKGENNPFLWVEYPATLGYEKRDTVKIFYHGKVVDKESGTIYLTSSRAWCPVQYTGNSSPSKKFMMDVTYRVPAPYSIISVGTCISKTVVEEGTTTRWITKNPVRGFSFNIGKFQEYRIAKDSLPSITVLMTSEGRDALQEDVGSDIQNSMRFYQNAYGDYPFDSLAASDIPYWRGEAYPGMINLSIATFQNDYGDRSDHIAFRAHEVAHQWWGISVGFESYHDQWLSEGFAEYSSLWFTQIRLHDNNKFFDMLSRAKENIYQARKYFISDGQKTGPISLGYRNESSRTRGDYGCIVYGKGAWVLHMIRNMMLDLKTMDEKPFMAMMKEFYTVYRGSQATTDDFKRMVEKYLNQDMAWFFDQWVYGTELPTYSFEYKSQKLPDNTYAVHCTVVTTDVSKNFKMPVPLSIDFGDDRFYRMRVMVQGQTCEFDLPVLPREPKKIQFNDLESVLCDVD